MVAVAKDIPETPIQSQIAAFTPVIPHLAEAATTQTDYLNYEDLIWLIVAVARLYEDQRDYKTSWHIYTMLKDA